jgi:hypothetical protein
MPSIPLFGKLGVACKDLLSKKYDYNNEIKVCTKADGGLTLEAVATDASKGGLSGFTTVKYSDKCLGDGEATIHTSGVPKDTKGKFKFTKLAPGVDVTLSGGADFNGNVDINYKQELASVNTKVSFGDSTKVDASACVGMDGITLGGSVASNDCASVTDYNIGAQYAQKDLTLTVVTAKQLNDVKVSVFHKYCKNLDWGAQVNLAKSNTLTIGSEYKLDCNTTLKVKGDTSGTVAGAVEHKVKDPQFKMNLAAEFATSNGLEAKKFGVGLVFGA